MSYHLYRDQNKKWIKSSNKIVRSVTDSGDDDGGGGGPGGGGPTTVPAASVHALHADVYDNTRTPIAAVDYNDDIAPGWTGYPDSLFWNGYQWMAYVPPLDAWFIHSGVADTIPLGTWSDNDLPDFYHPDGFYIIVSIP